MKGDGICECIGAAGRNQHPDSLGMHCGDMVGASGRQL